MNQFLNPVFLLRIAKSYLSEVNRIWKYDYDKLVAYQNKAFRNIVQFAYNNVPVYHKKYKENGIHPNEINTISDIQKLPIITKNDFRKAYPSKLISTKAKENQYFIVSTSGSTGKPVFLYHDRLATIRSLEAFVRVLKAYGGNWNKTKIILIIDLEPGSIESTLFASTISPFLKKFIPMSNIKYLHFGRNPDDLINEINEFQPEFLGSDPNMLRKLAFLKLNGKGSNISPKYIFSSGAMLDIYTKRYIEKAFSARTIDMYGTTEAGPLAFECIEGGYYHVHSDFIYLEALDKQNIPVSPGNQGKVILTKLFGSATPIIRYNGLGDLITPIEINSSCGICSQIIKDIQGRITDLIILPNGRQLSPFIITGIPAKVMEHFNSYKIQQFQIIQQDCNTIEVLVVIDEHLRNVGTPVNIILHELQKRFSERINQNISIHVKEVDAIQKDKRLDYVQVVISKVKHEM